MAVRFAACATATATPSVKASEAFKPRGPNLSRMTNMESIVFDDDDDETLAPAVVIATIALLSVFAVGFVIQAVGLVL